VKRFALPLAAAIILLLGCKKNIQNNEAVRQGILDHLATRPDLSNMDVIIRSATFKQDEANATVFFQAKEGPGAGQGMQMNYVLTRQGDKWVVKGRAGAGAHGVPSGVPPAAGAELPPGHPSVKQPDPSRKP
jgi:hypothetical protein